MKKRKHLKIYIILISLLIILNLAAWLGPTLGSITGVNWCDVYTEKIFPLWLNSYGRFTALFDFSFGEILLILGIIILLLSILFAIALIFLRKKKKLMDFAKKYYVVFAYAVIAVCFIMTLNCVILYHCTYMDANPEAEEKDYKIFELEILRDYVVEQCNEYSGKFSRDDNGSIIYDGDLQEEAKKAMLNISDRYPKLAGFYPDVKSLKMSNLMSQMGMLGYYFPFSLEANCNGICYITNYPSTYCHELSHLHGYIYEDEANFIAFVACTESEDVFFQYCGWLSVLYYVDNAYWESIEENAAYYEARPNWNDTVDYDETFLVPEVWVEVDEEAIIPTGVVSAAASDFTEASLKVNGVSDGLAAYDRVVELLLQYYDGVLY